VRMAWRFRANSGSVAIRRSTSSRHKVAYMDCATTGTFADHAPGAKLRVAVLGTTRSRDSAGSE
jgi:hypothetical protein